MKILVMKSLKTVYETFSQATILCDLLVLKCMKNRSYYKDKKYLVIRSPDAFDIEPGQNPEDPEYARFVEGHEDNDN